MQIASNVTRRAAASRGRRLGLTVLASENLAIAGSTVVRSASPTAGPPPRSSARWRPSAGRGRAAELRLQPGPGRRRAGAGDAGRSGPAAGRRRAIHPGEAQDSGRAPHGQGHQCADRGDRFGDRRHPPRPRGRGGAALRRGGRARRSRTPTAPAWRARLPRASGCWARRRPRGCSPCTPSPPARPSAESTTFNILKGINWAVGQGARVINMSFAGPSGPFARARAQARLRQGHRADRRRRQCRRRNLPRCFPAPIRYVIAVTATDVDDKLFTGANRGKYISVAAPGVDILVPAPESDYQITTGTSVAAAEVSGIVALLLERNPKLTPADIRRILTASARRLGAGRARRQFRLRPDRSAQGAATGRSAHRGHDAARPRRRCGSAEPSRVIAARPGVADPARGAPGLPMPQGVRGLPFSTRIAAPQASSVRKRCHSAPIGQRSWQTLTWRDASPSRSGKKSVGEIACHDHH